jgi:transcriptional regulator GlxA family with amidase domain
MDKRVETIIAIMNDDLHRVLTLSKMARSVNLSTSRFHYLFKAEISMPPARYLRIVRMQAAKVLLETTFLSVKEIVALAGFNDESHFLRNFKKLYGVTPSEHRGRIPRSANQSHDQAATSPHSKFGQ